MAVIVPVMQMPDNCNVRSCDFCNMDEEERAYCINGEEVTEYADICKKHPACPLKSVDGLIEKIEDRYPDHQCTGEFTGYAEAIEDIIEIIREYCGEVSE